MILAVHAGPLFVRSWALLCFKMECCLPVTTGELPEQWNVPGGILHRTLLSHALFRTTLQRSQSTDPNARTRSQGMPLLLSEGSLE